MVTNVPTSPKFFHPWLKLLVHQCCYSIVTFLFSDIATNVSLANNVI